MKPAEIDNFYEAMERLATMVAKPKKVTQMIKEMYVEGDGTVAARGKSIFGAFMLYGSFITMFIHILNILGIMSGD